MSARSIRTYMGDARGHWEGDTLVVETTNFKDQTAYRGANGATLRLIERFKPIGARHVEWSVTVNDPHDLDAAVDVRDEPDEEGREPAAVRNACHEGNYGMRNILSAARAEEKARGRTASPRLQRQVRR